MNRTETDRLLTRGEVERITGLGRSCLYRLMGDGEFPRPLKISPRAVRWPASEVEAWIGNLPRSHGAANVH